MKCTNLFAILTLCALLPFYSCGSDSPASDNAETTGTTETVPADDAAGTLSQDAPVGTLQAPTTEQAAPAPTTGSAPPSGVKHYTCPKNCKGSGGDAAGNCPVCKTAYVHNQAFHGQAPAGVTPPAGTPGANPVTPVTTPPPPSPDKNAAGVFHYTCAKGCAGGAGAAGKCAKCGGELAHNAAFHQ